ncbi:MAG: STAS domain-containing protein [Verrucomicrobia bacterium]|nr:STAS domain-containing protein [Verrucomicrobiota bacterium]
MKASLVEWWRRARVALGSILKGRPIDPFPLAGDLRGYDRRKFRSDARAGLNVALLAIPQGMAYAVIADVPIYFGITCSAIASLAAAPFAGSRHTVLGPTNGTALMIFGFFATLDDPAAKVILLPLMVFFVGLILVTGACLRVADLLQYISRSVVVGYLTGAAALIMANQLPQVLGAGLSPGKPRVRTFFDLLADLAAAIPDWQWEPLLLSAVTAAVFLLVRRSKPDWPVFAISLTLASAVHGVLRHFDFQVETFEPFSLANLRPAVPHFPGGIAHSVNLLFGISISVAFLAATENSIMSKTLASRSGDRPDQNQDLLGLGIANLIASFFNSLPASGSLTRSQLNYSSGAETRMAGVFSGLLCLAGTLLLAMPGCQILTCIPKCALATLVICIACSLIHRRQIRICLAATRSDAAVTWSTFLATLVLPFHQAVFLGVAISIMLYLRKASRPEMVEYHLTEEGEVRESSDGSRQHPLISLIHVEGELFFGAAEILRDQVQRACSDPNLKVIVLRMRNAHRLDATSVMALEDLARFLRGTGRHLILSGTTPEVFGILFRSHTLESIGVENVFAHDPGRPNWSTREALHRARDLLGGEEAAIRIFVDPKARKNPPP